MGSDEDGVQRFAHDEDSVRREKADEDEGVDYETTASDLAAIQHNHRDMGGFWGGKSRENIHKACEKNTRGLQKMYSMLGKKDVLL